MISWRRLSMSFSVILASSRLELIPEIQNEDLIQNCWTQLAIVRNSWQLSETIGNCQEQLANCQEQLATVRNSWQLSEIIQNCLYKWQPFLQSVFSDSCQKFLTVFDSCQIFSDSCQLFLTVAKHFLTVAICF